MPWPSTCSPLALDFDYSELREREYPLLAPAALAARLRLVAELFPPNPRLRVRRPLPPPRLENKVGG